MASPPADASSLEPGSLRTLFLSDLHLGCRHAQVGPLLEFLQPLRPRELYLVGDVFDGWELRRRRRWPRDCSLVLERFASLARQGTRIRYTPGNHDAFLRQPFLPDLLRAADANVEIADEFIHETRSGRRLLVLHGDRFDPIEQQHPWVSRLSARLHNVLLGTNRLVTRFWRADDVSPHAWCGRVKRRVKRRLCLRAQIWERLELYARQRGCDGVVFGHLHTPTLALHDGFLRANTGDWVEHCSAIAEGGDGSLHLLPYYAADVEARALSPQELVPADLRRP